MSICWCFFLSIKFVPSYQCFFGIPKPFSDGLSSLYNVGEAESQLYSCKQHREKITKIVCTADWDKWFSVPNRAETVQLHGRYLLFRVVISQRNYNLSGKITSARTRGQSRPICRCYLYIYLNYQMFSLFFFIANIALY